MKKTGLIVIAIVLFLGSCASPKYCPTYGKDTTPVENPSEEDVRG
jgi:hypothetical protein